MDQPINTDGDVIVNLVNESWQKGACPPAWGSVLVDVYLFDGTEPDSFELNAPFTGNFKLQVAASAETGVNPDIIAGRQGVFEVSADPANDPQWVQYEIAAVGLVSILTSVFSGRISYALDDTWYQLDMGVPYNGAWGNYNNWLEVV